MTQNSERTGGFGFLSVFGILLLSTLIPFAGAHATPFSVLYNFQGKSDGGLPTGNLIADASGNVYGETIAGGQYGYGTVFKLLPDGTESALFAFDGTDGAYPEGGLVMDSSGNLYGTTITDTVTGYGTVFEVDPRGDETVLWYFGSGNDGAYPTAGVILDSSGNAYGTTFNGGTGSCSSGFPNGCGTIFEVQSIGSETVLYSFQGGSDGAFPFSQLIMDASGNFFGTTSGFDGTSNGTVFEFSGGAETVLYDFQGGSDGANPVAGVALDSTTGNLFGTTGYGGGSCNCGTIFKLTPSNQESILHAFQGASVGGDGAYPFGGVTLDGKGNLFATTCGSGESPPNCTEYYAGPGKVCSKGCDNGDAVGDMGCCGSEQPSSETGKGFRVLHAFSGRQGSGPSAGMLLLNGSLYGETEYGGKGSKSASCGGIGQEPGCGVIFKLGP